jgi:hypothetical protein
MKMQEGYLGLAPAAAQKGDQVCIILGSEAPLVLRPAGQDEWLVVGPCHVTGIGDGKVFLVQLPDRYRRVLRFGETSGNWCWAYKDD